MVDYAPPPGLELQFAFLVAAYDHAESFPANLSFWPTFALDDRAPVRKQLIARRQDCMEQLRDKGQCELRDLKLNDHTVSVQVDGRCLITTRHIGNEQKVVRVALPEKISSLLPAGVAPLPPLNCEREKTSGLQLNWQQLATNSYGAVADYATPRLTVMMPLRLG